LEEAMIRGDEFTKVEIENLMKHPLIAPLLRSLVLVSGDKLGFWDDISATNKTIRIAHCSDLHASGRWSDFQKQAFKKQLVQPFKQIFRELYLPSADELAAVGISRRYAGYKVQPKQAAALFRTRAWSANYNFGLQKVFHKEKITAQIDSFGEWYEENAMGSVSEIQEVRFKNKYSHEFLPLKDIPKAIFSEIMRDLDLVVSVAHVGGVDIEASLSSIELRGVIVMETAEIMGLKNVCVEKTHVFIKGTKADYTVHLGSGIAFKMPEEMLNITPVSTQERGRIFLPFVDEDPKTAEIVSKVLLLAKE
jgi:hypothetical protein